MKKRQPQTTQEAVEDLTRALNEVGRLIKAEVERTAQQINAIWKGKWRC